jgi:transposase-like protein
MWLFAHRKGSTKVVPDGQTFTEQCPTCQQRTRFVEVAITEKYGLFFIDMIKDEERAFRCTRCGDVFDLRDTEPAPSKKPAATSTVVAKPAVDRADVERIEKKIDDELAELKRRLGK